MRIGRERGSRCSKGMRKRRTQRSKRERKVPPPRMQGIGSRKRKRETVKEVEAQLIEAETLLTEIETHHSQRGKERDHTETWIKRMII